MTDPKTKTFLLTEQGQLLENSFSKYVGELDANAKCFVAYDMVTESFLAKIWREDRASFPAGDIDQFADAAKSITEWADKTLSGHTRKEEDPMQETRKTDESVYDFEDRCVTAVNPNACLERTWRGCPWAMPCTRDKGHKGECEFDYRLFEDK